MNREDLKTALDEAPVIDLIQESKQNEALQDLLRHPGLPLLWGLMQGSRQTQFQLLAKSPLTNAGDVSRASVIQGTIYGIELFYNTLLEQAVPAGNEQSQEQTQ